jgi:chromosomal replication initiation ATPase DnaA
MYLAHVALGWSYSEIGRAFGRDRTTAAYACRQVEERREDPAFDAALRALEEVLLRSPRDHAVRREGAV